MTDRYWTGLGLADGTTIDAVNVDDAGNTDADGVTDTVAYTAGGTVTPTNVTTRQVAPIGPGMSITGNAVGHAYMNLGHAASRGHAIQFIYTPSAAPTSQDNVIVVSRSNNDTAFTGYVAHMTTNVLQFRNASATAFTNGTTPTLTAGHSYRVDFIVDTNSGTPSTSNGRAICRVISLSSSTWNTTGRFFLDTGYTVNVGTTQPNRWRFGKTNANALMPQAYYTGIRWGDRSALNTATDQPTAEAQFISITSFYTLRPAVAPYRHLLVR